MALLPPWPFLDGGAAAVEVVSELDGDVLEVRYAAGETAAPLVDGDGALCVRRGDGGFELVVPRACDGWVAARGRLVTLGELRQCGVAAVPIGPRTEACVHVGAMQFRVAGTTPPSRQALAPRLEWSRWAGATAAALAGVCCGLWLLGEPPRWRHELALVDARLMRVRLDAPVPGAALGTRPGAATMSAPALRERRASGRQEETRAQTQTQTQTQQKAAKAVSQNSHSNANTQADGQSAESASARAAASGGAPAAAAAMDRASARALAVAQARAAGAVGVIGADGRRLIGVLVASYGARADATASVTAVSFSDGKFSAAGVPDSSGTSAGNSSAGSSTATGTSSGGGGVGSATGTSSSAGSSTATGTSSGGGGAGSATGRDGDGSGALEGGAIGDAYGVAGLGLAGTGAGGGGSDDGTIGLGNLGTIGYGGGGGESYGYGHGAGGLGGRRAHTVEVEGAVAVTHGGCGRDWIRRVVRAHLNELKFCYERALQREPTLAGRVVERFVIAPGGRVLSTAVATTTLDDAAVPACVNEAVRRWLFPGCDTPAEVTYPFIFMPTE